MPTKVFITGITGYISGDAFVELFKKHPEYEYSALVRTQEKAQTVKKAYPNVRTVIGGNDDADILKKEAAQADIVLHSADSSDHEGAAKSIAAGLIEGHSKERPGYWLHTGGTGILTFTDAKSGNLGQKSEKVYNDWTGVEELVNLPDDAFHRNVDKLVIDTGKNNADVVKTAIVCPPTIYGQGRGPISGRGRQAYELAKFVLNNKYVPIIGAGQAQWNNIHVHDLSKVYLLLAEAAASKRNDDGLWGEKGYYLTENGEHVWGDIARLVGKTGVEQGALPKDVEEKALGREEALKVAGFEAESWGLNSRGKAERASRLLGWKPTEKSLEDEVPAIVKVERERLG